MFLNSEDREEKKETRIDMIKKESKIKHNFVRFSAYAYIVYAYLQ